jgi:hypothetical protein
VGEGDLLVRWEWTLEREFGEDVREVVSREEWSRDMELSGCEF